MRPRRSAVATLTEWVGASKSLQGVANAEFTPNLLGGACSRRQLSRPRRTLWGNERPCGGP
jgi:hypothetical protein